MRILSLLLLSAIVVTGCKSSGTNQSAIPEANQVAPQTPPKRSGSLPILFLVGDSTVYNRAPGLVGWGDVIGRYFDPAKITVENHARPGRSTRTFIRQGWWGQILAEGRPGDFVIIQLGHNDSSPINDSNRSRGTLPGIGNESTNLLNGLTHEMETVHTYGWYLRQYVAEARAEGMTPILCTPVSRLPQPGKELDTTQHSIWVRELAAQDRVPLIDLNQRALDRWNPMTIEEIKTNYFAVHETTHFNQAGAELNAACVVEGIRSLTNCPLQDFLVSKP